MGCVSSKHFRKELKEDNIIVNNGGGGGKCVNHVVSLTSTTYGALKLESNEKRQQQHQEEEEEPIKEIVTESKKMQQRSPVKEEPEVINTWELMEDLEEGGGIPISNHSKKSPKTRVLLRGFADMEARSPLKFLNQIGSPRKAKTFGGKENKVRKISDFSPRPVFKSNNSTLKSSKAVLKLSYPVKESPSIDNSEVTSRRRSFSPLFDPELVALYEKELTEEEGQIKRIICQTPKSLTLKNVKELESILNTFEKKCPPGGDNAVVIYTTTLRGIRKTFEDCNIVRSIIESHHIHLVERDISMDSGFKEELRGLMGKKEVKVPLVFVKGRLIGGADQVVKLDEGKLEILFHGILKQLADECEGCGGVRFVMCMECNGSCKVLDVEQKKMVKCGECNENGLIHCPICC
ncbi:uncharacterized protein At3g28850 isoform X3 [Jatropha curcas]|uniref:uncharacterized protein At3g28850 isoform X1 n=1 Tax=Jatropha curcas TaxID=180498 RepID=UPI001893230A|nr:uncharacterized protein At3g28850 isoform X1 [Jatropha curcas]XP_037494738.1 uncharacterized protein At3g28850 isoform X2 [Jatropha curcas]XP_037494739.1 uncharacterized protein At3g28850 isoform X3 [Jatropha curcas]